MPRQKRVVHHGILNRLDPVHHGALEAMLLTKRASLTAARDWLAALGVRVPLGAVCRYRDHVLAEKERRRRLDAEADEEAMAAVRFAEIARDEEIPDLTAASITLFQLLMAETVVLLKHADLTSQDLRLYLDAIMAVHEADARWRLRQPGAPAPSSN